METPKMVVFVDKRYAVCEANKMAVRSTQGQNMAVRKGVTLILIYLDFFSKTDILKILTRIYYRYVLSLLRTINKVCAPYAYSEYYFFEM